MSRFLAEFNRWVFGRWFGRITWSLGSATVLSLVALLMGMSRLSEPGYSENVDQPVAAIGRALTLPEASASLDRVLSYACAHGFTQGTAAWLMPDSSDDIGSWYQGLRAARERIAEVDAGATPQLREMVLINVRNTVERTAVPGRMEYARYRWLFRPLNGLLLFSLSTFFAYAVCALALLFKDDSKKAK